MSSPPIRVAVIDSGWDTSRKEPRVRVGIGFHDPSAPFVPRRSDEYHDTNGHGTACVDLVLRCSTVTEVVPVKVFGDRVETGAAVLIEAIDWCALAGVRVVSMSLGTTLPARQVGLREACERAAAKGLILVAAHSPSNTPMMPAAYESVISVGAAQRPFVPFDFEPGADDWREILAPIAGLRARFPHGLAGGVSFASMACPQVAGASALLLARHPGLDRAGVRNALLDRAMQETLRAELAPPAYASAGSRAAGQA